MNWNEAMKLLGVAPSATLDEVRARYRELAKHRPPETDPEGFAKLRTALEIASDPRRRAYDRVRGPTPMIELDDMLDELRRLPRRPLGIDAWLEILRR